MMRVVLIGNFPVQYWKDQLKYSGNIIQNARSNYTLAISLARLPHAEVHYFTTYGNLLSDYSCKHGKLTIHFFAKNFKYANLITGFEHIRRKMQHKIDNINPDIVVGIGTEHIFPSIALRSQRPYAIIIRGILGEVYRKMGRLSLKQHMFRYLERIVIHKAANIICISPYVAEHIKTYTSAELYFIENTADYHFFSVNAKPEQSKVCLFVGTIQPRKAVLELCRTMKRVVNRHPDWHLKIVGGVGDEDYYSKLRSFVDENNLRDSVRFTGQLDSHEVALEMEKAGILVLPSYEETAPMCIIEAMAIGIPVIGSDAGGTCHLVESGMSGYIIEPGNEKQLEDRLLELMGKPDLRVKMGRNAKNVALGRFYPDVMAEKLFNILEDICM